MGFNIMADDYQIVFNEEKILVRNIYCAGRNYVDHVNELNNELPIEPFFFQKSIPSLNIHNEVLIKDNVEIHHELEIVLLIGKNGISKSAHHANSFIAGYTLGIDLTDRVYQESLKNKRLPWLLSKSFIGSAIVSKFEKSEITEDFWLKINGDEKQRGNKDLMIFKLQDLVYFLSNKIPLMKGDLIFTGTPHGVGPVNIGAEEMVTINELVDIAAKVAGKKVEKVHIKGPLGVRGRNSDNTLIREKLGWDYSITLEEGIKKTYEWIKWQQCKKIYS